MLSKFVPYVQCVQCYSKDVQQIGQRGILFAEFFDEVTERIDDTIDEFSFLLKGHVHALSWVGHSRCSRGGPSTTAATWVGCQWVTVCVKGGLGRVASVPVVVIDALAVPVKDVHVVDHLVLVDDGFGA